MGNADSTINTENYIPQTTVEKKLGNLDLNSNDKNSEIIQYAISWNEGGNNVLLTGDFVNWNQYFEMVKLKETNTFTLNLTLPKKPIQFKFIVDGVWKCSQNYQIVPDNSYNLNNCIDLTNVETNITPDNEKQSTQNKASKERESTDDDNVSEAETTYSETKSRRTSRESTRISQVSEIDGYNNIYPSTTDLLTKAPKAPNYYKAPFDLDYKSNQHNIGKQKHLNFKNVTNSLMNTNSSFIDLPIPMPHINVKHLLSEKHECSETYIKCATSHRTRLKTVTFIYYKPTKK